MNLIRNTTGVGGGVSGPSTFIGKICTHFLFKFTKVQINMQTYCPLNVLSGPPH